VLDPLVNRQDVFKFISEYNTHTATAKIEETGGAKASVTQHQSANSDLIYYRFKNVSVNQNNRIALPVFEHSVQYSDVYHCKLMENDHKAEEVPKVWHAIKLRNATDIPWTSGPVTVFEQGNFVAQTSMTRNPVGADALIDVAEALGTTYSIPVN
jgi:hypothetical protein